MAVTDGTINSTFANVEYHCQKKLLILIPPGCVTVGDAQVVSRMSIAAQAACERSVLRQEQASCAVACIKPHVKLSQCM
jgi:hypothetical protein